MQAFLYTLLTMSLAASIAALGVMLLRLLLNKAPRALVCALWLVVLFRMLCPLSFSLPVSLVPEEVASGTVTRQMLPARSAVSAAPEEDRTLSAERAPREAGSERIPNPVPALSRQSVDPYTVLFVLWGTGAAGLLLWSGLSYGRLRWRVREAVRLEGSLYESDRISSPFVCGLLRPRIYLPVGVDPEDRRYVILHERAHLRRGDHICKPIARLALCLHWFNPFLWLAFRLYGRDVESACDQRVVRGFDREDTAGYAAALLHLGQRRTLPLAVPLAFGEENPKGRIRHVLAYHRPAAGLVVVALLVCLAGGVLLLANPLHRVGQVSSAHLFFPGTAQGAVGMPRELSSELEGILSHCRWTPSSLPAETMLPDTGQDPYVTLTRSANGLLSYTVFQKEEKSWLLRSRTQGEMVTDLSLFTLDQSFDKAYEAWLSEADAYLWQSRPDALYDLGPITAQNANDLSPVLDACNFWTIFPDAYDVYLDTGKQPCTLSFQLHQLPPLLSQRRVLEDYLRDVSRVLQTLVPNIGPVQWSQSVAGGDWSLPAHFPGSVSSRAAFRDLYREMEGAARALLPPFSISEHREPLYLSPSLREENSGLPLLFNLDLRMDRFDLTLSRPDGSDPLENASLSHPIYDCHILKEGEFPREAGIDLNAYQEKHCTSVSYWRGRDSGFRLYELDQDLFLAKYTEDVLDYVIRLQ